MPLRSFVLIGRWREPLYPQAPYNHPVRPAVGIPLCLDARGRWRRGRDYLYIDAAYARAVAAAGGAAIHLPLQHADGLVSEEAAATLMARVDALLLPGGDDFPPEPGGGAYPDEVTFDVAEPGQVAFDRALLRAAIAARKPVLGICYGMQLMALEAGGALHHHLPIDVPGALEHGGASGTTHHALAIEADSRLERWLDGGTCEVNSRHHQAVRDAGTLRPVASAPDGVLEAIESAPGAAFQLGVQWHPESLEGPAGAGLLRRFVELAGSAGAGSG